MCAEFFLYGMVQFASTFQTEYSVLKDPLRFLLRLRTHICHILKSLDNFIKRLGQGDLKRRLGRLFLNHPVLVKNDFVIFILLCCLGCLMVIANLSFTS